MALKVGQAFQRVSANPIDESFVLTKSQMLSVNDSLMPSVYFTVCEDDQKFYIYKKDATPSAETGKFTMYGGDGSYDDSALVARITANENAIADMYTKAEVAQEINDKLANFDKLDYKVADSAPTATEVVIKGKTEPVVAGTRYLVKELLENRFKEYVVLDGTVYNLGTATGGGSSALENALTVSNPIGKYVKDQVIPADTTYEELFRGILSKTYYPTLTPPSASIGFNVPTLAKVGAPITGGNVNVAFNRGSINPKYTSESEYRSGVATEYSIAITNADEPYSESNGTGQFVVPSFTKTSKGTATITATVAHEAGVQPKDSDGANYQTPLAASSVSASKSVEFILPFIHGVSASSTVTNFDGMIEDLKKKGDKEYTYDTNNEHMVFAYDASYGELSEIYDPNNFAAITGFTSSVVQVDGQQYRVYVADSATIDTGAKYTFKF